MRITTVLSYNKRIKVHNILLFNAKRRLVTPSSGKISQKFTITRERFIENGYSNFNHKGCCFRNNIMAARYSTNTLYFSNRLRVS